MTVLIKDHPACALPDLFAPHFAMTPRVARQLQSAVLKKGALDIPELQGVARTLIAKVREHARVPHLELLERVISPTDGFARYVFRGEDEQRFEAVRIPIVHRPGDEKVIVCVSSQVGCAMGCTFCATGRLGFRRNLQTWEIVDQVLKIAADSELPVRGVVFMGMGEPFLNYDRVMRACQVLSESSGPAIDAKGISISTVGIVPAIRRFTEEKRPYRLVVSLTSALSDKRNSVLPVEAIHPLPELMAAVRDYHVATRKRVIFAWTLIQGFNTSASDAQALAELTAGLPVRLDLIDVNDTTGSFFPPSDDERNAFRDALQEHLKMPVARRYSGGRDIRGACGMLAAGQELTQAPGARLGSLHVLPSD